MRRQPARREVVHRVRRIRELNAALVKHFYLACDALRLCLVLPLLFLLAAPEVSLPLGVLGQPLGAFLGSLVSTVVRPRLAVDPLGRFNRRTAGRSTTRSTFEPLAPQCRQLKTRFRELTEKRSWPAHEGQGPAYSFAAIFVSFGAQSSWATISESALRASSKKSRMASLMARFQRLGGNHGRDGRWQFRPPRLGGRWTCRSYREPAIFSIARQARL